MANHCNFVWCNVRIYWWPFAAVKDSKIFAKSTVYGAVTNIVLNLIFTPVIGALGAAIATTVSI